MNILNVIRKLTDKQNGIGISMAVIARYCGCHPATINYYLKGAQPRPEVIAQYEAGITKLKEDIMKEIGE